jgi:DNA replication protein DnaC
MTREELDAALALTLATAAAGTEARPPTTPTRMTVDALKSSVGVTLVDLERRMTIKLARAERDEQARSEQAKAAEASRRAIRATIEPRIEAKLLAALRAHRTPCALLLGPTGCGKTSAAHWIMVGHVCNLIRSRDLATASRRHGLGEGYPPEVERAREGLLCVIDDVGSEGSEVATLQDILDHRYSRGFPTIVTTGLTMTELRSHLGAAHYRRIIDQHVPRNDGTEFPVLIVDCHEGGS